MEGREAAGRRTSALMETLSLRRSECSGRRCPSLDVRFLWQPAQGWLCGVTLAPGTGATAYYQYVYDPEGNLIATTTRTSAGCDLNIAPWQNFVVDQYGNQITELDAAGNWKHTNVFANGELLATYSPTGVHFAMGDWQGSKRVQASAAGAIEDTCWNLPFNDGLGCSASSGTDATEHHYTGKEYDPFTGLDLFGARDFTKYSGRFISPDWSVKPEDIPYADLENPQSLNLYAYVRNNPLTNVDDDGHYIPFQQQWPTTGWGSSGTLQMIASFTSSITGSMFADLAQQQNGSSSQHGGIKGWFLGLIGKHQTTFKVTSRIIIGTTVISGVADGGASEAAVPAEVAGEAALETAAEAEVAASEAAEAAQASEGAGSRALDNLKSIEKAQQRIRSGADGGRRIIDVIQKSADRVGHMLNRITQGDYDPDEWE